VPFHCAAELEMKPVPLIVTAVAPAPAPMDDGVRLLMAGTGFWLGGGVVVAPDGPPPQAAAKKMQARVRTRTRRRGAGRFMRESRVQQVSSFRGPRGKRQP
jgi:hypothetical protein